MSRYDELFEETAPDASVFADKGALDPLADPDRVVPRAEQEQQLAALLGGITDGYLPNTVSIYGPPGTGKTLTTRRLCRAYAERTAAFDYEYVNLKECRTIFSAANEILVELTGEKKGSYAGLDGVFDAIWTALESSPEWVVLVLDEIDHIRRDANYDPSDFFYRLLRGEGKLARGLHVSAWLISNELMTVDLRVDSRVESAMGDEDVFFPPYDAAELRSILAPRVERAFRDGCLSAAAFDRGITEAAWRWGDARKALRLFRHAGDRANAAELDAVTVECITQSLEATEREAVVAKLQRLPQRHLAVLAASVGWRDPATGDIVQPVRTKRIHERLNHPDTAERFHLGQRAVQQLVAELDTMGLLDTWTESHGRGGRATYAETTFDPEWVRAAEARAAADITDTAAPEDP